MWRRIACQTLSKALDVSSSTASVVPDLLKDLQPFTKYLRLTPVSMWNSALQEKFNICLSRGFASIDKTFILAGRLGTRLSFYEV